MTSLSRNDHEAQIPNVPRRFGESATDHVVRMLDEGIPTDDPSILTVGFRQEETSMGSLDTVTEIICGLRERDIHVTGYDTDTAMETIGDANDTPTDCYDAVLVFSPLHTVDGLSVEDLVSDDDTDQFVIDLTGTVDPAAVAKHDAICVTYRVL